MKKNGNTIENIHDEIDGYHGIWRKPNGETVPVKGTWALGPSLSWFYETRVTETGFQCGEYIMVCGHWQV